MGREHFFFLSHDSESRSLLCLLLSIDKQHCGFLHIFEEPLAELQAGHRDFLHTAHRATSASGLADLAAEQAPLGPAARSGVETLPAELSLRMVSCKSAISFPSVLIFFHGFFSLCLSGMHIFV